MGKIDWFYLRRPLIMLGACIIVSILLVLAGWQYEKVQSEKYQESLSTLQTSHTLLRNIANDIDLLEKYRALYDGY